MTRVCSRCKEELPIEAFNRLRNGHQYWCRQCFRAYFRARGHVHLEQVQRAKRQRQAAARALILGHLRTHGCADCGESDIRVLEFDHVRGKQANMSALLADAADARQISDEIARCDVVCCNCHRQRTARRAGWHRLTGASFPGEAKRPRRWRNVRWIYAQLAEARCADCGLADLLVLEFDHVRGKRANVLDLAWSEASIARLEAEIALCEIRCCNCHRRRTALTGGWLRAEPVP